MVMSELSTTQDNAFNHLIKTTVECMLSATVEGASMNSLRYRLIQTEQEAEKQGLSIEDIQLALQIGEYRSKVGK